MPFGTSGEQIPLRWWTELLTMYPEDAVTHRDTLEINGQTWKKVIYETAPLRQKQLVSKDVRRRVEQGDAAQYPISERKSVWYENERDTLTVEAVASAGNGERVEYIVAARHHKGRNESWVFDNHDDAFRAAARFVKSYSNVDAGFDGKTPKEQWQTAVRAVAP